MGRPDWIFLVFSYRQQIARALGGEDEKEGHPLMSTVNDLVLRAVARLQAEEGQTMVEYGLILALVSVVAITILIALGGNVVATFTSASSAL